MLKKKTALFVSLAATLLMSTAALAEFREIPGTEGQQLLTQVRAQLYSFVQYQESIRGRGNCFMPSEDGIGVFFNRDGRRYTRDFFLRSNSSTMETSIFADDLTGTILITQGFFARGNHLYVFTQNDAIAGIRLVLDAGSARELPIDCQW